MIVSICDDNAIGRDVLRALLLEYQKQQKKKLEKMERFLAEYLQRKFRIY